MYTNIDKETILSHYTEYDIYAYYLGKNFKIGDVFNSPLRVDNNPSFGIFKASNGHLLFKDLGSGESGDWIKFVQLKENKRTREQAIISIYLKMVLKKGEIPKAVPYIKEKQSIGIQRGKFASYDLQYWAQYNISESILNFFNVFKAYKVYLGEDLVMIHNRFNPIYAFKIFSKFTIYRPKALKRIEKWMKNTSICDLGGYEQLPESGDLLIISKALKDVMMLYSIEYPAISPNSETSSIPTHIIDILKKRFKTILICFDNDEAGIKAAKKLKEKTDINYFHIPKEINEKDLTDYCAVHGIDKTKELLKELIDHATKN